jgi:hypothetical protein
MEADMRLIHRQRSHRRKAPRIAFTQEEIAADLHYPASRRFDDAVVASSRRRSRR